MPASSSSDVILFASPVAVGHVRPLIPLARRLVERGVSVIWAISGDPDEPAAAWREPLAKLGVTFVDVDEVAPFPRGMTDEMRGGTGIAPLLRRITARANDVTTAATDAIAAAAAGRTIVAGIYDFFALWAYVAMQRLAVPRVHAVVSAFPSIMSTLPDDVQRQDPVVRQELARLRATGAHRLDAPLRGSVLPDDPALRVLAFTSSLVCPEAPPFVELLGIPREALPRAGAAAEVPAEHRPLIARLRETRAAGTPIMLLSMGTMVTRMALRGGPLSLAFLRELYTTLAVAALDAGALVVASTTVASAADLGVDEAALGARAHDRVIAMPFVPQPLLLAHGLVDLMLMHGGANTFHETVLAGVPVLVSPAFGDQEHVARATTQLGLGQSIANPAFPALAGARPLAQLVADVPAMLAPDANPWRETARRLATAVEAEDGLEVATRVLRGA